VRMRKWESCKSGDPAKKKPKPRNYKYSAEMSFLRKELDKTEDNLTEEESHSASFQEIHASVRRAYFSNTFRPVASNGTGEAQVPSQTVRPPHRAQAPTQRLLLYQTRALPTNFAPPRPPHRTIPGFGTEYLHCNLTMKTPMQYDSL